MDNFKYYFRVESDGKPLTLYAIDQRDILMEWRFDRRSKVWERTDRLMYALISLDLDYEQTSFEEAIAFEPTFVEQMKLQGII